MSKKTEKELIDSPMRDAHNYADKLYHMEEGDDYSKYEKYIEVKTAYEQGYKQALEDYPDAKMLYDKMKDAYIKEMYGEKYYQEIYKKAADDK